MLQITVEVKGMVCGMCEAHVNEAIRKAFPVKKVSSSRSKGQTVILTQEDISETQLKAVIAQSGYEPGQITKQPDQKRGLFPFR